MFLELPPLTEGSEILMSVLLRSCLNIEEVNADLKDKTGHVCLTYLTKTTNFFLSFVVGT